MRALQTLALALTTLLLGSCGSMQVSNETLICILACVHSKTEAKKNGPEEPGRLKSQDAGDAEKDQAPQDDTN